MESKWGLTAAPIGYSANFRTAAEAEAAAPSELRIPALQELPVRVVTGGASAFAGFAESIVEFLSNAGAAAEWVHLPEHGISGNGHGLIFEANSDEVVRFVEDDLLGPMLD